MGWFGGFVSSFTSAISSAIGSLGSALSSFVSGVGTVIGTIIEKGPSFIGQFIGNFATAIFQAFGIIPQDQDAKDFGEKVIQAKAAGISLETSKDFKDYMDKLRDFVIDPEKAKNRPDAHKIISGLAVGTMAIENKLNAPEGSLHGIWMLPLINRDYFTSARVETILKSGTQINDVFAYLDGKLTPSQANSLAIELAAQDQGANPAAATDRACDALSEAYDVAQQLNRGDLDGYFEQQKA